MFKRKRFSCFSVSKQRLKKRLLSAKGPPEPSAIVCSLKFRKTEPVWKVTSDWKKVLLILHKHLIMGLSDVSLSLQRLTSFFRASQAEILSVIRWIMNITYTHLNDEFWSWRKTASHICFGTFDCRWVMMWGPSPVKASLADTSVVPLQSSYTSQHQQFHQQAWPTITKQKEKSWQAFYEATKNHHKAEEC